MAKLEEPQDIPSELLDGYRVALNSHSTANIVKKRYPFRMPPMQEGGKGVYPKQRSQRARFKTAVADFNELSQADRERWYAAEPPWGSFLWYYNYFIMSSLSGNANIDDGGAGLIKSIQFKQISMPAGAGEGQVAITAVDPAKSVVMLYGNSAIIYEWETGSVVVTVYPYTSSFAAALVKCKWSMASYSGENTKAATIGVTIIEYI